jgi:hypothetical protein
LPGPLEAGAVFMTEWLVGVGRDSAGRNELGLVV